MPPRDPSLLINILATETPTMKIPTHPITLDIETTLSPAGLRVMAEELAKLAETVPSAAHAMTYRSMAAAFEAQADAAEAIDAYEDRVIAEYCAATGATLVCKGHRLPPGKSGPWLPAD